MHNLSRSPSVFDFYCFNYFFISKYNKRVIRIHLKLDKVSLNTGIKNKLSLGLSPISISESINLFFIADVRFLLLHK